MKKIGIIGGVAWPSTLDYYRLICTYANRHFQDQGAGPPLPAPPIVIESLVMAETRKLRGTPGSDDGWGAFDAIFHDAFLRLQAAGAEFGLIASNTPHARLHAISQGLTLPIISILEVTAQITKTLKCESALTLGTSVTMQSPDYPNVLNKHGIKSLPQLPKDEIFRFQNVIDTDFYQGGTSAGREEILRLCQDHVADRESTAILLACTELPLAFPEHNDEMHFETDGFTFVNTTAAHAAAATRESIGPSYA